MPRAASNQRPSFPALAFHPAHLVMIGVSAAHANLALWRALLDASRIALRRQQDLALQALNLPLAEAAGSEAADDNAENVSEPDPYVEAARSLEYIGAHWGDAALAIQQRTLAAFWPSSLLPRRDP